MKLTLQKTMHTILVWDLPSRVVHWLFAGSLAVAMVIGFLADDDHSLFCLHMLFGIIALFMLAIRLVLGVAVSRYSRFASFPLQPQEILSYMGSAISSKTRLYPGNNPDSAMAAVFMFLLVPALFLTGIGRGGSRGRKNIHSSTREKHVERGDRKGHHGQGKYEGD